MGIKDHKSRLARWPLKLQAYYMNTVHRAGLKNGNTDALSRRTYKEIFQTVTLSELARGQCSAAEVNVVIDYLENCLLPGDDRLARQFLVGLQFYKLNEH